MTVVKWGLEALAIGPKGQQMDVQLGFESEPTAHNIEQGKISLERAVWAGFPAVFYADPARVEIHLIGVPEPS